MRKIGVEPMWLMLQQNQMIMLFHQESNTQLDSLSQSLQYINIDIVWKGEGKKELGINKNKQILVKVDPYYYRPNEVEDLLGDSNKAKEN